jgi:hypothetical protein
MAVTAHWIEATPTVAQPGENQQFNLCVELIGFCRVLGTHTGEHLAQAFYFVIKRLKISNKVSYTFLFLRFPY